MSAKPTEWTPSKLAAELRMDRRTVGRKLEGLVPHRKDRRGEYYWLRDIFDHFLKRNSKGPNLMEEQALLAEARRQKLELETEELRGQLCRVENVEQLWSEAIANAKAKLRAIPHDTAHQIMATKKFSDAVIILEEAVESALTELANDGIPARKAVDGSEESVDAPAKTNDKRVGRPKKKAVKRSRRAAG